MKKLFFIAISMIALFMATSCSKENDAEDKEKDLITQVLKSHGDTCFVKINGIYLYIMEEGEKQYGSSDIVKMIYSGVTLQDHNTFAQNDTMSFVYGTPKLIPGFIIALPYLKKGSKSQLIVPFNYGYGDRRTGTIEPYSTLHFTIELQ
ncbi:MAG: FKBP-type peptidyl-prolyl cis-trans isomerase [Bacteroidales bacterium]|nr:FKBP-type peptidyl-prolyl cis-trans isomerase [Bacteroidales bacterium]